MSDLARNPEDRFAGDRAGIPKHLRLVQVSLVIRKPAFGVSNQVQHKLDYTDTEDG